MIGITAATGHLGRSLLAKLAGRKDVVAIARNPQKAADLPVPVRIADYSDPKGWPAALEGIDKLLLIAGNEFGRRIPQHKTVIDAAGKAGVGQIAYTSAPHADVMTLPMFMDHRGTEEVLIASGVPYTMLRHTLHHEVYLPALLEARKTGLIMGSARSGRVASAGRNDFIEAAIAVLTTPGHQNKIYELNGDTSWSYYDLAGVASDLLGQRVVYRDMTTAEHHAALVASGLPPAVAEMWTASDAFIATDALNESSGHLAALIGRPITPLREGLARALAASTNHADTDFVAATGLTWLSENAKPSAR